MVERLTGSAETLLAAQAEREVGAFGPPTFFYARARRRRSRLVVAKSTDLVNQVKTLVEPVLAREGYELLEVEYASDRGRQVLRLYIDTVPPGTAERGVGVDDCSTVSRVVSDLLDVEDAVPGQYHLEVSSPGLFRPLTKPEHFDRVIGERVRVKTFEKIQDRKVFIGILKGHGEGVVVVDVDGTDHRIDLRKVSKANLEPDLSRNGS